MGTRYARLLILGAALAPVAARATPAADAQAASATARLTLRAAQLERAPQGDGRFAIRARFAREERAGELRESGGFVLLGRIAKAGAASCGGDTVFRNGFEGS
jgi:hypothetical protein